MFELKRVLILALVGGLLAWSAGATTVLQMNLEQLCDDSDLIYRGTVIDVTESTVSAGGGEIPALTYTLRVDELLKGDVPTVKGVSVAELSVVGTLKQYANHKSAIPGLPVLQVGHDYLLMVAPEGPVGLTATMGLGQGCFDIEGKAGSEMATNQANNVDLFKGMDVPSMPSSGPVTYAALRDLIRNILEGE